MISREAYLACLWVFSLPTTVTTVYSLKIRKSPWSYPHDGVIAATALLFFLAYTIILTLLTIEFFPLALLSPDDLREQVNNRLIELQLISTALNTTCLWLVKLGSLVSFFPLVDDDRYLRIAWFSTGVAILISWALCMACDPIALLDCIAGCGIRIAISYNLLWMYIIADIVTNSLVILLPLSMLLVAKTPFRHKVLPAARFSSTAIIIGISGARLGMSYTDTLFANLFWLHYFGSLQCCVELSIHNGLVALQHRNKRNRSTVSKPPNTTQEVRIYPSSSMGIVAAEEAATSAAVSSKHLPALPLYDFDGTPDNRSYSSRQTRSTMPRTSQVQSAFSFSTFSQD